MPILGTFSSASARVFRNAPASGGEDPYFNSVSLLVHADTNFADFSSNNLTAQNTNALLSTSQKKFGDGSIQFNSNGILSYTDSQAFDISSINFTLEFWFNIGAQPQGDYSSIVEIPNVLNIQKDTGASTGIRFFWIPSSFVTPIFTTSITLNSWTYVAFVKNGTTISGFINGNLISSVTRTTTSLGSSIKFGGLGYSGNTQYMNGYVDEIRLTKGVARYSSSFPPPTSAFPNN